jgi:C4-dicarboxylate-specific signal transduction histidine kinase
VTGHVLFVDDEDANLIVWEAACSDYFKVLVARSGNEAVELMQNHEIAVILADQRMPSMTGVELLEHVRDRSPDTVRILITAYSDLAAAIDAINRGNVRRYLRKPCALAELKAELADAFDFSEMRRRVRAMERRLLLTERVYSLGLVAAGLGRELDRPARWIRQSVSLARAELKRISDELDTRGSDVRLLKSKLTELEKQLGSALEGVERVSSIARSVSLPTDQSATENVDLNDVIRVSLRIVRGEIRRRAEIELDLTPVPAVRISSVKIGQVVLNLMANGIQAAASREGGGGLVTVRLHASQRMVQLEISDNGAPIPAPDLPHLFDPFHTSQAPRGVGLGLAISKAIVEEAGGTLEAANPPRGGAFFRVNLPEATTEEG